MFWMSDGLQLAEEHCAFECALSSASGLSCSPTIYTRSASWRLLYSGLNGEPNLPTNAPVREWPNTHVHTHGLADFVALRA